MAPLNPPDPEVDPRVAEAARAASTSAFHLSMLVAAGLMAAGAVVNGVGIRNPRPAGEQRRTTMAPARGCLTCETPVGDRADAP